MGGVRCVTPEFPLELASGSTRLFAVVCLFVCHIAVVLPLSCSPLVPLPPGRSAREAYDKHDQSETRTSSRGKRRKPLLISVARLMGRPLLRIGMSCSVGLGGIGRE